MANARVVTLKAGQNVSSLVRDLYAIPRTGARRIAEQAERAIIESNPHIADLSTIPAGTPIYVPELPNVAVSKEASTTAPASLSELAGDVAAAIREMRSTLAEEREVAVSEAKEALEILASSDLKAAARDRAIADHIESITSASKAAIRDAEARAKQHDQDLGALAKELQGLLKVTGLPDDSN